MEIEPGYDIATGNITQNPDDDFFKEFLKPYYVRTKDGQYLFASKQPGRRPDRAFYMVPDGYKLGKEQMSFDIETGKRIYKIALDYLKDATAIVQDRVQGEQDFEVGLKITTSVENPHSAYIAWMGRMMTFPGKENVKTQCWNYIVPEPLPDKYAKQIAKAWPDFKDAPIITLYDLTEMENNVRRVISLGVDYFGGAFKKPNLTMVWNKAEAGGLISYHAGCTYDRIMKGLSGTGKTTLTVGLQLEQDDAVAGKLEYVGEKVDTVKLIGLEAASYAKSEGLTDGSPEWPGLMKSTDGKAIVLAQNIDCEGVDYETREIADYEVKVPVATGEVGSLQCKQYEKSRTTNGRFIFLFSELNPDWGQSVEKYLKAEALSFKRFDVLEPMFRVVDPVMAVALDSACESIITSAVAGDTTGRRVRKYAATDFMAREQSEQALLKWKIYKDLDLGLDGKLVFFINNAGWVGKSDLDGRDTGEGEKVKVGDSKKLVDLVEHYRIKSWLKHPIYGYLVPDPRELEEEHGLVGFAKRFNPLNHYTAEEFIEFAKRDIEERTEFLDNLFSGQNGYEELQPVINVWRECALPGVEEIKEFYAENY